MVDKKPKKKVKVNKSGTRRGFSVDNILPNLKKAYNTLRPALNLPSLNMTKTLYDMNEAQQRKLENKVYKKSEKLPMRIWKNPNIPLFGDGSGRSFKNGGYSACINRFDGKRPESWCHKEQMEKGMRYTTGKGWVKK